MVHATCWHAVEQKYASWHLEHFVFAGLPQVSHLFFRGGDGGALCDAGASGAGGCGVGRDGIAGVGSVADAVVGIVIV